MPQASPGGAPPVSHNRVRIALLHSSRYAFEGQARLAADCGVSRSTISRLVSGRSQPSLRLAESVAAALSRALSRPIMPWDLFSPDGTYPEPSGCRLCGCRGCLPEEAFDRRGRLQPEWRSARPGDWSRSPQAPAAPEPSKNPDQPDLSVIS